MKRTRVALSEFPEDQQHSRAGRRFGAGIDLITTSSSQFSNRDNPIINTLKLFHLLWRRSIYGMRRHSFLRHVSCSTGGFVLSAFASRFTAAARHRRT
ncbi:MAG: hypothetical protein M2R45_00334 [Verrucomicrobia subdivision 3 bacterium]|nr:hypothetical protein [Limisphaerales bacterium]MCS1412907.1 hypothetical protein [Limisphaerales bacterium]